MKMIRIISTPMGVYTIGIQQIQRIFALRAGIYPAMMNGKNLNGI